MYSYTCASRGYEEERAGHKFAWKRYIRTSSMIFKSSLRFGDGGPSVVFLFSFFFCFVVFLISFLLALLWSESTLPTGRLGYFYLNLWKIPNECSFKIHKLAVWRIPTSLLYIFVFFLWMIYCPNEYVDWPTLVIFGWKSLSLNPTERTNASYRRCR